MTEAREKKKKNSKWRAQTRPLDWNPIKPFANA